MNSVRSLWYICLILGIAVIVISQNVNADPNQGEEEQPVNCNEYLINISKLNQTIGNLTFEIDKYRGLSEYYKALYESLNSNTSNRELIEIQQNLTTINNNMFDMSQRLGDIENNFTLFSIEIGASIVGGVTAVEFVLFLFRRRKSSHEKDKLFGIF